MKLNASAIFYKPYHYGSTRRPSGSTSTRSARKAREHKPKMILCGVQRLPARRSTSPSSAQIADEVGALLMADIAHIAGLVAGGVHPSPFPHAHVVTTTTHKTLRGPRGGLILTNDEELRQEDQPAVFPGMQGGPLMHIIAAKAVAFGEDLKPEFKTYAAAGRQERQGAGRRAARRRATASSVRRHRQPPDARRPAGRRARPASDAETGLRAGRHHRQQERHPERPAPAEGRPAASASARPPSPCGPRRGRLPRGRRRDRRLARRRARHRRAAGRIEAILDRRPLYSGCTSYGKVTR